MGEPVTRRGFVGRTAVSLVALSAGSRWARLDAAQAPSLAGREPATWAPSASMLRELPRLLELAMVPGLAVSVLDAGRAWQQAFGLAQRDPERAVDCATTLFEGASLGKPLFACAVMRLRESGLIDLDRPLHDYLRLPDADARTRRITARHALSHTAGLSNWRLKPGPLRPETDPGETFSYSGEGFFYLQRVMERLTGKPVEYFMADEVFRPLGMTQTGFAWRPEFATGMAMGYGDRGEPLEVYAAMGRRFEYVASEWKKPIADWRYEDMERALPLAFTDLPALPVYMVPNVAGSLITSLADYARFVAAVADATSPFLSAPARRDMATPQVRLNSALTWGLGWGIEETVNGPMLWHWGANGSFKNFVLVDPARGRGIVVLTNSANGPKIYQRLIADVTGTDHPAFLWFQL